MKRFFWMLLIFIFLFSLTALFAQEAATKANPNEDEGVKLEAEKVGKKVSDIKRVTVYRNKVIDLKKSEKVEASQERSEEPSKQIQVQKKVSKKKANPEFVKKPKALPAKDKQND